MWNVGGGWWGGGSFGVLVGFGTLLGPEESGPWPCCGGVGLFVLCLLSLVGAGVVSVRGLAGGVFDMWIVDASIWRQPGFLGCCLLFFVVALLLP